MSATHPNAARVVEAVAAYDARYGKVDNMMWRKSLAARPSLLNSMASSEVLDLIWTVKSRWGVQGVRSETRQLAGDAFAAFAWSEELFSKSAAYDAGGRSFAVESVSGLVQDMMRRGVKRREFSLVAKTMHWLLPWRIPMYDSFVRGFLGIPTTRDPANDYAQVVEWEFAVAGELMSQGDAWIGASQPGSPLRALDKYLWWEAGGKSSQAPPIA